MKRRGARGGRIRKASSPTIPSTSIFILRSVVVVLLLERQRP